MAPVNRTAVICRPNQMLEAAIALSCLTEQGAIPVLCVIDPSPVSAAQFRELHNEYTSATRNSMERITGTAHRRSIDPIDPEESLTLIAKSDRAQALLAEPRSWLQRNGRYARLLHRTKCDRVICLFLPGADDLKEHFLFGEPGDGLYELLLAEQEKDLVPADASRYLVLPLKAEIIPSGYRQLQYSDEHSLAEVCWREFRTDRFPHNPIQLPVSACARDILYSLYVALSNNLPLDVGCSTVVPLTSQIDSVLKHATEAVIAEPEDAQSLAAALYAFSKHLPFFIIETSATDEVAVEIRHINELSVAYSRDLESRGFSWNDVTHALRERLYGNNIAIHLKNIEKLVSANVDDLIVSQINDRSVTAFTTGMPYNFVRSQVGDWRRKAVGHVMNDKPLVVYTELLLDTPPVSDAIFTQILDPGFFDDHSETASLLELLEQHYAYPIVLSQRLASLDAVIRTSQTLPLDLVFFLSHGGEDSLALSDVTLTKSDVGQWVSFPTAPIVFNNSCLSWNGIGREMIRVGARGYVGTLWSVNSRDAANLGISCIRRVVEGETMAAAIRSTGVSGTTELAYIYIGTASSKVRESTASSRNVTASKLAAVEALLESTRGGELTHERNRELYQHLYQVAGRILERIEVDSSTQASILRLRCYQLSLINDMLQTLWFTKAHAVGVVDEAIRLREMASTGELEPDAPEISHLFRMRSHFNEFFGDIVAAENDLGKAELSTTDARAALRLMGDRADLLKRKGLWQEAIDLSEQAKKLAQELGETSTVMAFAGQLAQLMKRMGDVQAGLAYVREGRNIAETLNDWHEVMIFDTDEAALLLLAHRGAEALECARKAGRIARQHRSESDDLMALGVELNCLLALGRKVDALSAADAGLKAAIRIGSISQQAGFLSDLGKIKRSLSRPKDAAVYFCDAAKALDACGKLELIPGTLAAAIQCGVEAKDWKCIAVVVNESFAHHSRMEVGPRRELLGCVVVTLRDACQSLPGKETLDVLAALFKLSRDHCEIAEGTLLQEFEIASAAIAALFYWLSGSPKAELAAAEVDSHCMFDLSWTEFVKRAPPT